jgi:hypothetical protein
MFLRKNILYYSLAIVLFNVYLKLDAKPLSSQETCTNNECKETNWPSNKPTPQELCKFCDILMPIARYLIDKNDTKYFPDIAVFICQELKLADDVVCKYAIKAYEVLTFLFI